MPIEPPSCCLRSFVPHRAVCHRQIVRIAFGSVNTVEFASVPCFKQQGTLKPIRG